ncbi:MAG TPA: hypothetical protein VGK88_01280 [bacterium]|jgi:2,5-dihydroxypyridine 5,6-dioxygenase
MASGGQGRIGAGIPSGTIWPNDYGRYVELVGVAQDILGRSGVKAGTKVALNADTRKNRNLVDAFFAAALALKADAVLLLSPPRREMYQEMPPLVMAAIEKAEIVVNLLTVSHFYTESTSRAIDAGAGILAIWGSEDDLIKLEPSDDVAARVFQVAGVLERGEKVTFHSPGGTNVTLSKRGRRPHASPGYAHERYNWFAIPSATASASAIEDSVEGTVVIGPGDKLHKLMHTVQEPIRVEIRKGRITSIEGGPEADLLRSWFDSWGDDNVRTFAHLTIGCDDRASIHGPHAEWEHSLGTVTFGFGSNFPKPMGGKVRAASHMDFMMQNVSCEVDGVPLLVNGRVVGIGMEAAV